MLTRVISTVSKGENALGDILSVQIPERGAIHSN